ncbi:DUF1285 domain-containing protein [Shewanella sp. NFH-SH190041]|uniref:DUF1285 domain-containing protein n=1 Tax=Shewanella sp. NFH-SH190041 TaxID=2950245 RepID=UPI0021C3D210|nr:DUF1285 domain-containing protein [Shewanella sp. NFH-SH190041]BDM64942.1 DUF1285 domain-containing protein [Shewanella sp. NFH-SH190041]
MTRDRTAKAKTDLTGGTLANLLSATQKDSSTIGLDADPLGDFAITTLPQWCDEKPWFHIEADGSWLYQQDTLPMKFARMFSGVLYCLDGEYQLITPAERVRVSVAEVPLLLVDYRFNDEAFTVTTSLETEFTVPKKAVVCQEDRIVFHLPRGLSGKLNRACYYRFINDFVLA